MTKSLVFPAPCLVVGVGRLGLATLERLGDDWMGLELSGADDSIRNLRLIAVRPPPAGGDPEGAGAAAGTWNERELPAARIVRHLGEGDLPSRALDLAVLRALGLVRYRDGTYQVGLPRDGGVVDLEPAAPEGSDAPAPPRVSHRRRWFEWVGLSPDPIVAAERLRELIDQSQELDLFLTPLVNRVRQGHSPPALLAAIGRCFTLLGGRDPSPWPWLGRWLGVWADGAPATAPAAAPPETDAAGGVRLEVTPEATGLDEAARRVEEHLAELPEPLPGWREWLARPGGEAAPALALPAPLVPRSGDPPSPVAPRDLLARDWEETSWAIDGRGSASPVFQALPASAFRLGLFDHDGRGAGAEVGGRFAARLAELGNFVHQGLVRLWMDLQRLRGGERETHLKLQGRARDHLAEALQQSLEILGELVVRPLAAGDGGAGEDPAPRLPARPEAAAERELPAEPSRYLSSMVVEVGSPEDPVAHLLAERLAELGLAEPGEVERFRRPLLTDVVLRRAEVDDSCTAGSERLEGLRQALNGQVRSLFDFGFLTRYRQRPTRRPPRLTVFVVADMSEPFVRESVRPVLREVHAELLRAFTPIFRTYREGFDRSLCVTPILWMPHPADAFEGGAADATRCEEAAIIDAVHGIRHWVECVLPAGKRFIPQIFVNSRVTDVATLGLREAVRQTRDFLSFQIRNDLAADPWLRGTAAGSGQADLFSSFSCYESDFPALRCREYLANRMARELLGVIQEPPELPPAGARPEGDPLGRFAPPALDDLVAGLREELAAVTRRSAETEGAAVRGRLAIGLATRTSELEDAYDPRFELDLRRRILGHWRELTGRMGKIDDLVDELRRHTSALLARRLRELRAHDDDLILESIGEGGLSHALGALHRLRASCRDLFLEREAERRERETLAQRHAIPDLAPLASARERLLSAAREKPDPEPIRLGLLLLAFLALVLGAPLTHAVAYLADLHLHGGVLEALLGPLGPITGGLALFIPAWLLLRRHLRRRTLAVREAREGMALTAERILRGTGRPLVAEPPTSIRSFLEARLELTGAVAARGFALHVLERALADTHLGERLRRSLDVQSRILARRAEDLGVRATLSPGDGADEDLERLLEGHGGARSERLITAPSLHRYYRTVIRRPADLLAELPSFVPEAGGIGRWRSEACLAATDRILGYCRRTFREIVEEAVWEQTFFREDVSRSLVQFVARCYSNLGFGAEFRGYEGLDPDGVPVVADASLVLHKELVPVFEEARRAGVVPTTRTLDVRPAPIRPNAVYMLSLVQGIRVHSVRNLRRFESFHDRVRMPDDRAFPLTQETGDPGRGRPLNPLSGFESFARERSRLVRRAARRVERGEPT